MANGFKSAKVAANNNAVAFGTGYAKFLQISTYGNSGDVYLGGSDVTNLNGLRVAKDQILHGTEFTNQAGDEEFDLASCYVYSSGSDGVSFLYVKRD